jgi:perosamine synthetase
MQNLLDKGISTRRGIMLAHKEKAYQCYDIQLPKSEFYSNNSLLLPIYYGLSETEIDYIIDSVIEMVK